MAFHYPIGGGSGGGGVTSLNTLTGALNLVEGAGIDITTAGSDITIAAIGANVSNDTSLAVKVSTTAALPGTPTYNNGTAGVGATLTRSSNGTTGTIDGVTAANLMVGDYILVKNQAAQLQNGVYSVTQQGSASLPYILTRVAEADTTAELDDLVVTAASGTTNKGVPFGQQTNNPVIGTDNIVFTATGIYMRQQTSGTQAVNQIPVYTGTALTQTKGTANFKYNPTNDLFTIRGIDYTFPDNNGDASQVLTTDGSGTLSWTTPSGGGQIAFTKTKAEIDALIAANDLVAGALYEITGVHPTLYDDGTTSGTTVYLRAISGSKLEVQGMGKFYNPKYNQSVDGFGIWDNKMYGTFSGIVGVFDYQGKEAVTANNAATGVLLADGMIKFVSGDWSTATSIIGAVSGATANIAGFVRPSYGVGDKVIGCRS